MAALLAAACWLLAGCVGGPRLIEPTTTAVELADTPFHPQEKYQCGPASLAMMLGAAGVEIAPEQLVQEVYVPGRRGSLSIEMQAAPRRHGLVSYPLAPELDAILEELSAGRPVLVLHNYGLPFWPRWHYAVAIGFDPAQQRILLRSGTRQRQKMSARNFMRAWDNGGRWAMVLLRPGELPARPELPAYLEAATGFERAATPAAARAAFDAATQQWPADPVAWVGRGTANYRAGDLRAAALDYARAIAIDPGLAAARNNRAMALLKLGCPSGARSELSRIDTAPLSESLRAAVADTARQIDAHPTAADSGTCFALY